MLQATFMIPPLLLALLVAGSLLMSRTIKKSDSGDEDGDEDGEKGCGGSAEEAELMRLAAEYEEEQRARCASFLQRKPAEAFRRADEYRQQQLDETKSLAPPLTLPGLLSTQEMLAVYHEMDIASADQWVPCGEAHRKLFLHSRFGDGRRLGEACPHVLSKLVRSMEACTSLRDSAWRAVGAADATAAPELHVRCVEFHRYTSGGGLTELAHKDVGSALTLSVQLSPPEPAEHGGRFTTTAADGCVTEHELQQGDAIVFCSEMVHNVTTLRAGLRESLVIELWSRAPNRVDRYR